MSFTLLHVNWHVVLGWRFASRLVEYPTGSFDMTVRQHSTTSLTLRHSHSSLVKTANGVTQAQDCWSICTVGAALVTEVLQIEEKR